MYDAQWYVRPVVQWTVVHLTVVRRTVSVAARRRHRNPNVSFHYSASVHAPRRRGPTLRRALSPSDQDDRRRPSRRWKHRSRPPPAAIRRPTELIYAASETDPVPSAAPSSIDDYRYRLLAQPTTSCSNEGVSGIYVLPGQSYDQQSYETVVRRTIVQQTVSRTVGIRNTTVRRTVVRRIVVRRRMMNTEQSTMVSRMTSYDRQTYDE